MTETKMRLEDWLDDLCVRFIINLPREELESVERICFQVEEAQWFYEDFIRPLDPALPSLSLKAFALRIFQHCPLMSQWSHYHHITAFSEFLAYKTRVPVRGAIMLNQDMDEVVLVKGWKKGANWSFPRGKINKGEKDLDCAIREVYEETGYDVREAGLVKDENDVKFIEITMREQHMRLYVFRGVSKDAYFEPRTRKEISKIEWYKLSELPTLMKKSKQNEESFAVTNANKFYMVAPFMNPLKKWIAQQKKLDAKTQVGSVKQMEGDISMDEAFQPFIKNILPIQPSGEISVPSDLPEVASSQDASSHLKRLLNINSAFHVQDQGLSSITPSQVTQSDSSKSNALLELLRGGSSRQPASQVLSNEQVSPPHAISGINPTPQPQPYLAPGFFPGFLQQGQFAGAGHGNPQFPPPLHHLPPHLPPSVHLPLVNQPPTQRPLGQEFPSVNQPGPPAGHHGLEQLLQRQPSAQLYPNGPLPSGLHADPQRQRTAPAPAPYQRTGDPEFSQPAQHPQIQGATVPPASKLPPPKLTSHSLALLNVFKNEPSKTANISNVDNLVPLSEKTPDGRKPSQHQDQLLSLLKGSPVTSAPGPAELSAQPVSPAGKQILQRPRGDSGSPKQSIPAKGSVRPAAIVSRPPNVPHVEAIMKPPARKVQNGSSRKGTKDRQAQPLASPITILARPQSAKKEHSPISVTAHASQSPSSRTSSQSRANKAKAVEPPKPFQPQILRRSENANLGSILPSRTKDISESEQQADSPSPIPRQEMNPPQVNFDRRPSQTPAQKEALLSLFGKSPVSPSVSPVGKPDLHSSAPKPPGSSPTVSPFSPLNIHRGDHNVENGAPTDEDPRTLNTSSVATPVNKAFLLGFLEGVAKGSK